MAHLGIARHATTIGIAAAFAVSLLPIASPTPARAAAASRWGVESEAPAGNTHGWFTDDTDYPISVSLIDPTIPGYDPDTIIVYGGVVHLALVGPNGAPITAGSYAGVTDLHAPVAGHAGMEYYEPHANCGGWNGTLEVWTLTRDGGGAVTSLSADYSATCSTGVVVKGQVRFNAVRPVAALVDPVFDDVETSIGQTTVGQSVDALLHYSNRGDTSVHLGVPTITGTDAAAFTVLAGGCKGATLTAGAACDLAVRFTASHTGQAPAVMEITTDTPMGHRRLAITARGVTPTTTTLTGSTGPHVVGDSLSYDGTVSPAPAGADRGSVKVMFTDAVYGYGYELGSTTTAPDGTFHLEAVAPVNLQGRAFHVAAEYSGTFTGNNYLPNTSSPPLDVKILTPTQSAISSSLNPALSTVPVKITATVWADGATMNGGTLSIVDELAGTTIASAPVSSTTLGTVEVTRAFSTGTHHLVAHYSGDDTWAPSQAAMNQVVNQDAAVAATGLGVTPATFYPVKDGYLDRLTVRGTFKEPGSVAVKVVNAGTGKTVRTASLPSVNGAYSWAWDGRTAAGSLVPAGRYRVVQTLRDTGGNALVSAAYATVSLKKLVWSSASVTLGGRQFIASGKEGGGTVSTAGSAYGGVKLASGRGWAAVSYRFPARSAAAYGNVTFKVQGRSTGAGKAMIGIWHPSWGSWEYVDSYDAWKTAGTAYGWYLTTAPGATHHGGGYIRSTVVVDASVARATFDVAKVTITYRYAVLK